MLIAEVEAALDRSDVKKRNVILAALAELSASYIQDIQRAEESAKTVAGAS
jgi:hypothetical protein